MWYKLNIKIPNIDINKIQNRAIEEDNKYQ